MYRQVSHCPHAVDIREFNQDDIASPNSCEVCGVSGPNLWICIHRNCTLFVGCGEAFQDHSTEHYKIHPEHHLTINSTTYRIWCYACETEVFIENNTVDDSCQTKRKFRSLAHNSIQTSQVYVADAVDEDSTDDEDTLIGMEIRQLSQFLNEIANGFNVCVKQTLALKLKSMFISKT